MSQRKRLSTIAVEHGRSVLRTFEDAAADGRIDESEALDLRRELVDWLQISRATDVAQQVGQAIARGIGDPQYLQSLVGAYQTATDELPDAA